jgi:hypothetical protein
MCGTCPASGSSPVPQPGPCEPARVSAHPPRPNPKCWRCFLLRDKRPGPGTSSAQHATSSSHIKLVRRFESSTTLVSCLTSRSQQSRLSHAALYGLPRSKNRTDPEFPGLCLARSQARLQPLSFLFAGSNSLHCAS